MCFAITTAIWLVIAVYTFWAISRDAAGSRLVENKDIIFVFLLSFFWPITFMVLMALICPGGARQLIDQINTIYVATRKLWGRE